MQSRISSFIESLVNILIGYSVALISQLIIFPQYGIHISLNDNLFIGAWFTAISLIRSYVIRRWFNKRLHQAAMMIDQSNEIIPNSFKWKFIK